MAPSGKYPGGWFRRLMRLLPLLHQGDQLPQFSPRLPLEEAEEARLHVCLGEIGFRRDVGHDDSCSGFHLRFAGLGEGRIIELTPMHRHDGLPDLTPRPRLLPRGPVPALQLAAFGALEDGLSVLSYEDPGGRPQLEVLYGVPRPRIHEHALLEVVPLDEAGQVHAAIRALENIQHHLIEERLLPCILWAQGDLIDLMPQAIFVLPPPLMELRVINILVILCVGPNTLDKVTNQRHETSCLTGLACQAEFDLVKGEARRALRRRPHRPADLCK
mmetsp:Transcript_128930/g.321600  ORF Transcript_128930/g.321600 Transcript_128930/m.321600 type:complete len:273 (-) Transcript_128930:1368-2186(-)